MIAIRSAAASDLEALATIAAEHQVDPTRHIPYLPLAADAIAADIESIDDWTSVTAVAEDGDGVAGWLLAEVDADMGRLWWWGPFAPVAAWAEVADGLHAHLVAVVASGMSEEEACGDARAEGLAAWAGRHGLSRGPGSALLRLDARPAGDRDPHIRPLAAGDHGVVGAIHAKAFANAHLTPAGLVESEHPRLVIERGGRVVGYVAHEIQNDGSGYIDFLAVAADHRGQGLGGRLVHAASVDLFDAGATFVHLSVREENTAARQLYAHVGFVEERVAVPFRRGFSIGGSG